MPDDLILGRIAIWSGFLMLFGVLSDRSSWVTYAKNTSSSVTDAGIYNVIASASGVVALIALAIALNTRPRVVIPVLSLVPVLAAFGLSTYVSGLSVWARLQGEIWFYGAWSFAGEVGKKEVAYPSRGVFIFAFLALLGTLATLGLALTWLFGDREQQRAAIDEIRARRTFLTRSSRQLIERVLLLEGAMMRLLRRDAAASLCVAVALWPPLGWAGPGCVGSCPRSPCAQPTNVFTSRRMSCSRLPVIRRHAGRIRGRTPLRHPHTRPRQPGTPAGRSDAAGDGGCRTEKAPKLYRQVSRRRLRG